MSRILVTGASGFLGSHLVPRLYPQDCDIVAFPHQQCDLSDMRSIEACANIILSCDVIIHLATDKSFALHDLTSNLMSIAQPQYVIYASTADVYGAPVCRPPIAEDHPINPQTVYAAQKAAGEACLKTHAIEYGLRIAILRFPHLYGPGDTSGKLIPRTISAIKEGHRPTICGSGTDKRDYLYIEDAVDAIVRVLATQASGIYNIGTGVGTKVVDVVQSILSGFNSDLKPEMFPATGPVTSIVLDVTKARERLGFVAATDFETGIAKMLSTRWPHPKRDGE